MKPGGAAGAIASTWEGCAAGSAGKQPPAEFLCLQQRLIPLPACFVRGNSFFRLLVEFFVVVVVVTAASVISLLSI